MLQTFVVRVNEKGILMRDGDFRRILPPGRHRFLPFGGRATVSTCTQDSVMPSDAVVDYLLQHQAAGAELPTHLIACLNTANLKARTVAGLEGVLVAQVPAYHVGVLCENGRVVELLPSGMKAFWRFHRDIQMELVDTRLQSMEVSGQEILTRDRVGLRLNFVASWRFTDVEAAFAAIGKPVEYLYRELQFGLRAAVGTRSIDAILENKQDIDEPFAKLRKIGF